MDPAKYVMYNILIASSTCKNHSKVVIRQKLFDWELVGTFAFGHVVTC